MENLSETAWYYIDIRPSWPAFTSLVVTLQQAGKPPLGFAAEGVGGSSRVNAVLPGFYSPGGPRIDRLRA
ncbi:hypothetical protein MGG_15254 [Pyricularia oryzae 70-15]|uniref:Uncharacterized protein n=1 Tax=Pyricularia oryzae (strain 70-15 / ATCC MYA-4617 / FGSC 8958) TaxID=242507 RepID=A4QYZ4_PYRO7|nr:uncharacterized protein MGG_15254 [Pyricularia oryzae 70-15]EHA53234.1 hypothetical protein MGG_15254 [Pyricularia oryzae 70-15]